MPVLKTITFAYRALEDRVLAAVNLGHPDGWSCWLTRRLSLALLERAGKLLASSSPLASRAAPGYREELAAFEQDAAMAATAKGMSPTPRDALDPSAPGAELAVKLTITPQGERLRIELAGDRGGAATGLLQRADFQRILRMLEAEVLRGKWVMVAKAPEPAQQTDAPKPVRH
jgi:hypothetical protein